MKPTRRTVLGFAYAASVAAAAGACGLRLDLPQPAPPVPTRRLVPDEKLLVGAVRELDELVAGARSITRGGRSAPILATLARLFSDQARVVTGRLTNDGVPSEVIRPPGAAAAGASTASGTAAPAPKTAKPALTVAAYVEQLDSLDSGHWAGIAAATPDNRELLVSLASVRLAGCLLLGGELPFGSPPTAARAHLAERTAPLVYGFEVVAAQSSGAARTRALAALEEATDLLHALGGTSSEAPGGWSLPFPVTTPKEAARLAQHLLGTAVAATVIEADRTLDARSLDEIARWSARVQVVAAHWGIPLTAFPGMSS